MPSRVTLKLPTKPSSSSRGCSAGLRCGNCLPLRAQAAPRSGARRFRRGDGRARRGVRPAVGVLNQDDAHTAGGEVGGGLHTGDAAANDQSAAVVGQPNLLERRAAGACPRQPQSCGWPSPWRPPGHGVRPGHLLADVDVFVEVGVHAPAQHGAAEGLLMQKGRARCDDHAFTLSLRMSLLMSCWPGSEHMKV